jgi:hypothetical protein
MSRVRDWFKLAWRGRWPTRYPLWNVGFWQVVCTVICVLFAPNEPLLIALRVGMISVWSACFIIFLPDAWRNMFSLEPTSGEKLCLAIGISAISIIGLSNISVLWRISDQRWIADSDINVIFCIAGLWAGLLHCRAPESIKGQMPRRDRFTLGAAVGVAVAVTTVVLILQPHVQTWIGDLRPFFPNVSASIFSW